MSCATGWKRVDRAVLACWAAWAFGAVLPLWAAPAPAETSDRTEPTRIERYLAGGESHVYPLEFDGEMDAVWIVVDQRGIDVELRWGPAVPRGRESSSFDIGEPRGMIDSPEGLWGVEWLRIEAAESEDAVLEVRSLEPFAAPGRYGLRIEQRSADDDSARWAERAATRAGRADLLATAEGRREALALHTDALAEWRALGRRDEAIRTVFRQAQLHRWLDEPTAALESYRLAYEGWVRLGDRHGQAQALFEWGVTEARSGAKQEAAAHLERALALWRENPGSIAARAGEAHTLNQLGLSYLGEDPTAAREPLERARDLFADLGDTRQVAVVENNLGGVHDRLGEPRAARERFQTALAIQESLGDRREQAALWNNLASLERRAGRLQDALEGYRRSLALRRALGDPRQEARTLNNLALVWRALGSNARARELLDQALVLRRASGDRRGEARTLHNLGSVAADRGDWAEASRVLSEALGLRRSLGDRSGEATTRIALGRAAGRLGQLDAARRHLQAALSGLAGPGDAWHRARAHVALAEIETSSGHPAQALSRLESALVAFRTLEDAVGESETLLAIAAARRRLAEAAETPPATRRDLLRQAYERAVEALAGLESVRSEVVDLDLRTSFLTLHVEGYALAVDLAALLHRLEPDAGWAARALETAERSRGRGLLDSLARSAGSSGDRRAPRSASRHDARRAEHLEDLRTAVVAQQRALASPRGVSSKQASERARAVRAARSRLAAFEAAAAAEASNTLGTRARSAERPLDAPGIQALLTTPRGESHSETLLLVVALGERRSHLVAVEPDRIDLYELPPRHRLEDQARALLVAWSELDPTAVAVDHTLAARLSNALLGPVAARLARSRDLDAAPRLVVVADGALHSLPFGALPAPSTDPSSEAVRVARPLLADREVIQLASLSTLASARHPDASASRSTAASSASHGIVVFADPIVSPDDARLPGVQRNPSPPSDGFERLPWSASEAESIVEAARSAADFGATAPPVDLLSGFDASLDAVRRGRLSNRRVLHFATHGAVDTGHPELSALVLSRFDAAGTPIAGLLRPAEIAQLRLDADLVVLSGCRTALGRETPGEGLMGLGRAFFAAGARQVIGSHWRVQDRATAELMRRLYRHLLRDGESPATALRRAQLALRQDPEFADPYFWAGFVHSGDWR